jgi:Uma2 family endonuclease
MILTEKSPAEIGQEARRRGEGSLVLNDVSWEMYQAIRWDDANRHLRMTYDCGVLEIMSPQKKHGKIQVLLDHMIHAWTRYKGTEIESAGDLTCDREDLLKALEPDLCYWVTNLDLVREKDTIDLTIDPPPDLALEVDITRMSIPKLPIYQALKVPEVWRWHNGLDIRRLDNSGVYIVSRESGALPGFPFQLAEDVIQKRHKVGENALLKQFENAIAQHGL